MMPSTPVSIQGVMGQMIAIIRDMLFYQGWLNDDDGKENSIFRLLPAKHDKSWGEDVSDL